MKTDFSVTLGGEQQQATLEQLGPTRFALALADEVLELDVCRVGPGAFHVLCGLASHDVVVVGKPPRLTVQVDAREVPVTLLDERQAARLAATGAAGGAGLDGTVTAPMPGKVVKVLVAGGQRVTMGEGVVVVEAMKMENELKSPIDGVVESIRIKEGQNVEAGEELLLVVASE